MNMDTEIELARRVGVGLGLGRVADTLDAHKGNVGNVVIDMREGNLNHCGSPMCFAGLYASITTSKEELEDKNFSYGARLIEKECGFDYKFGLARWARDNPKLWGNKNGISIFSGKSAFGIEGKTFSLTLNAIIAYLRSVSTRCASV